MCSEKKCPRCGAAIHAEASFCPYCAKPVNSRKQLMPARRMSRRMRYSILMIFAALIGLTSWWLYTRPRVYDNGTAEARYTMGGQTYQLCIRKLACAKRINQNRNRSAYTNSVS